MFGGRIPAVTRCAVYARFSSDLQRATSLVDQVAVARAYAQQHGWTVLDGHVYQDAGISGASIDGRPGLQALMAAAAQQPRPFDALLVDDSSRVARDLPDAIRVLQMLTFLGVRVIYISQAIDGASEQAETLITVHGLVDGLYLREARAKIRRGLAGQHSRGFSTGAITFGYRTVPEEDPSGRLGPDGRPALLGKRLEIAPREAPTVRLIFELYAASVGVETIVTRLNRGGHPGPRGRRWRVGAVRAALRCEKYRGFLIWGRQTVARRPGTRQRVLRTLPREEWYIAERPELRIVSEDLWFRVQARAQEVRQLFGLKAGQSLVRGKNARVYSRHLFSGFLRCGVCGGSVTVVTGGKGSPRYGCCQSWKQGVDVCSNRHTIRAKVADAVLLAGLQAALLRPETVAYVTALLAADLNRVIDQRPALRAAAEAALAEARRRRAHLIHAIETGAPVVSLLEALRKREAEILRFEGELETLSEPLDQKLALMPTWVRQQLEDVVALLADTPERTKGEYRRLGLLYVLHPARDDRGRAFLRAQGTTAIANLVSGQHLQGSTADATDLRSGP
jgi:site-specific DNA recombinase